MPWKSLLEEWPRLLLIDEFARLQLTVLTFDEESVSNAANALSDYHVRWLKSAEKFQEILRKAFQKSRVLLINLGRINNSPDIFYRELSCLGKTLIDTISPPGAHGDLQRIIVTGGRMSPDSYFGLVSAFRLYAVQRPLQFSLINCDMLYSASEFACNHISPAYQLFSEECGEARMPKFALLCPTNDDTVCRQLFRTFIWLFFPYTLTQIDWMESCLNAVKYLEDSYLSGDSSLSLSAYRLVKSTHFHFTTSQPLKRFGISD